MCENEIGFSPIFTFNLTNLINKLKEVYDELSNTNLRTVLPNSLTAIKFVCVCIKTLSFDRYYLTLDLTLNHNHDHNLALNHNHDLTLDLNHNLNLDHVLTLNHTLDHDLNLVKSKSNNLINLIFFNQ